MGWSGADDYVKALKKVQMGNHGVAQVLARHKARRANKEAQRVPYDDYTSDDSWPEMAEKDVFFPFDKANKKAMHAASIFQVCLADCMNSACLWPD